jgi:Ca-activated chloride channel homolog
MKYWLILFLLTALPWGLAAQNTPTEPLPTAPSATKFPPQPSAPPPASQGGQSGAPATTSPATVADPSPQAGNPASPSAQSSLAPKPAPAGEPPTSNGVPAPDSAASGTPKTGEDPDDTVTVIRKRVNEVNVVFTVTDKRGHYVKDLTQNDVRVFDDNKPAESVRSFSRETNLPLRVGLLIDASNSVRDRFKFEQEAAIEFLNQIIRRTSDKAFVIGFDTTPEVTQDMTDDTEALSHGVRMLRPGGGTAMYDAIYFACRDKLMQDKSTSATRRAIILLSDGEDNQSRVSREEAVEMAQRAEVIIYTISTNVSGLKLRGDKILEHFAEETGGKAFFPFKIQDVSNAFSEISDELRSQYDVSYKPADFLANGKYRKIEILADNKKYKVRARKGYYAPTQ